MNRRSTAAAGRPDRGSSTTWCTAAGRPTGKLPSPARAGSKAGSMARRLEPYRSACSCCP